MVEISPADTCCDSCSKNQRDDGVKVYRITLGYSMKNTVSQALCSSCFDDTLAKLREIQS